MVRDTLAMEAIYRRDCAALLSRQARAREIAGLRLPLTRFEMETIELDSPRRPEALLCARETACRWKKWPPRAFPTVTRRCCSRKFQRMQQKFLSVHPGRDLDPIGVGWLPPLSNHRKKEPDVGTIRSSQSGRPTDSQSSFFGPDHANTFGGVTLLA